MVSQEYLKTGTIESTVGICSGPAIVISISEIKSKLMEQIAIKQQSLDILIVTFLTDLAHGNRSPHTRRANAVNLARLGKFYRGRLQADG